ncbi:MAG: ABC transporter substrate-binding protein [Chloroflexi bacterium]|nr:ABC transporter substrate-binding protein [Chloroflexota bacterium]
MIKTPSVSRRAVIRTGLAGLAGGVGAAALAACGETQVVTKEVPVEKTVVKEVPVEKIVRETEVKEVPVERIVTQEVEKLVTRTVEVKQVVEVPVEVEVEKVVEVEKIVERVVEKIVQQAAERAPGIDIYNLDESVPIGAKPWDPKPGGEVSYMTFGNPTGFDPATWGGRSAEPAAVMYDLLYTYGSGNLIYPHLASDLPEPADDKLSWVIPLRNDVVFHDGEPFNADAAVFNFHRFLDPELARGHVIRDVASMGSVEKVDDFKIRIHTPQPQSPPSFLHSIAHQHTGMASPKAVTERGEAFSRDPVGTGPFKWSGVWEDDVKVVFDRNEDYNWGPSFLAHQGAPYPDRMRIQILGYNMTDNAAAFEAGEVDICLNWSFADYKRVSENAKYHVIGYAAPGMGQYMPLHTQLWPLDDLNVRKALLFGVDRRTVTVRANGGTAPLNISNLLVPGTIGRSAEAGNLYAYDVGKANQILDEGGYAEKDSDGFRLAPDGRRLEISYPDRGDPVVELFKLDVEKNLGIFVDIPKMDGATHREGASKGLYHTTWIGVAAPSGDVMYDRFHTASYGGANRSYSFFEYDGVPESATPNAKIDGLLEAARASFDAEEAKALWEEAELYLMENAVAIPLVHDYLPWLTNPDRIGGELFLGIDYLPFFGQFYSTQE